MRDLGLSLTPGFPDDSHGSSYSQHQMPQFRLRRSDFDFNVISKSCQAIHQFALRQIGEVTTHHVGDFGLGDAHAFGSFLLRQGKAIRMTGSLAHEDGLREAKWAPIWYNHSAKCIRVTSVLVEFINNKSITFSGSALNRAFHPDVVYQCSGANKIR